MYGFSTIRLAAAITRLTRVGADAGAITRPSTSAAFSGGGGGGSNVAPPPLGEGEEGSANAVPAPTGTSRHAAAANAARSSLCELTKDGILFRTPAGLADGLALKELARLLEGQEVRPSGRSHLGSPAPRYRGFGVPARLPDVFESLRTCELIESVRIYTSSARRILPRAFRASRRGAEPSSLISAHAISAIRLAVIAATVR